MEGVIISPDEHLYAFLFGLIDIESVNLSWLPPYWENSPSLLIPSVFPVSTCTIVPIYQLYHAFYVILKVLLEQESVIYEP